MTAASSSIAQGRLADAQSGAAPFALRLLRLHCARARERGLGCCATTKAVSIDILTGLDDENFTEIVKQI